MTLDPKAMEALKNHQRQIDADGSFVGVSRQALDELIAAYEALALRTGAEPVAWRWKAAGRTDRAAWVYSHVEPQWPEGEGFVVQSLYVAPQPTEPVAVTDEMVERAAEIVWNDLFGARTGPWERGSQVVSYVQMRASARAALTAAMGGDRG